MYIGASCGLKASVEILKATSSTIWAVNTNEMMEETCPFSLWVKAMALKLLVP
jgi:hypothetical protein